MLRYSTPQFSGSSVQYSPYFDNKIAVGSGANYGLVGNGKLSLLDIQPNGSLLLTNAFLTQDNVFDISWSEMNENQIITAQGDGTIRLFDINLSKYPLQVIKAHEKEVFSCNWNLVNKQNFVSSSWDGTCKIWDPERGQCVANWMPASKTLENGIHLQNKATCVHQAMFSPHDPNLVISCSSTSHITLKDVRSANQTSIIGHHGLEALSVDFNKYQPFIFCSGGADKLVRVWDYRMMSSESSLVHRNRRKPLHDHVGHRLAVKKVAWSPHCDDVIMSTSYDTTVKIWGKNRVRKTFRHHTEFTTGCDWSLWGAPGFVATCGWDGNIFVWNALQ